jgi:hypothetical protein
VTASVSAVNPSIRTLALSLFRREYRDAPFMVMTAYFDESGTHGAESPVTIVAGFGATVAQWVGFEKLLTKLYKDFNINIYHAKDFRGTKNDFEDWDLDTKARFNSRLLRIIDMQLAFGAAALVKRADYQDHYRSRGFPRKARPDTEYGICFRAAATRSLLFIEQRARDWPLNFVLELGHKNYSDAIRVFQDLKARPNLAPALGGISFVSKHDCPFLGIADQLAYNLFRNEAGYSKHPTNPIAVPTGPADPPYYVHKIPVRRVILEEKGLKMLHKQHARPIKSAPLIGRRG